MRMVIHQEYIYVISNLQRNESGHYEYISVGYWYSAHKKNTLVLNNTDRVEKVLQDALSHVVME